MMAQLFKLAINNKAGNLQYISLKEKKNM